MWHGHGISPSVLDSTRHPWWVHTAVNALKSPSVGWVTTTFAPPTTKHPPTGTSEVLASLSPPPDSLLAASLGEAYTVRAAPMMSQIGSGALPVEQLPSFGLAIVPAGGGKRGSGRALARLEAALRALPYPVIGRISDQTLWLDLRCLEAGDEARLSLQFAELRA